MRSSPELDLQRTTGRAMGLTEVLDVEAVSGSLTSLLLMSTNCESPIGTFIRVSGFNTRKFI